MTDRPVTMMDVRHNCKVRTWGQQCFQIASSPAYDKEGADKQLRAINALYLISLELQGSALRRSQSTIANLLSE